MSFSWTSMAALVLGLALASHAFGQFNPDPDGDGRTFLNGGDNCPFTPNPDQENADGDLAGDACDNCPDVPNASLSDPLNIQRNSDNDSFGDACDNCPMIGNEDQADTDMDGVGDACDRCPGFDDFMDSDGDGIPDGCDDEFNGQCVGNCCTTTITIDLPFRGDEVIPIEEAGNLRAGIDFTIQLPYCWDTGGFDHISGQAVIQDPAPLAWESPIGRRSKRAYDDFYLPGCKFYRLSRACVMMLVDVDGRPDTELEIYEDCNGRPGNLVGVFPQLLARDTGFDAFGLDLYEIRYLTDDCRLRGECSYWICPVGHGDGSLQDKYFWATAGHQDPIAEQALVKDGDGEIQPISTTNAGCTDLSFSVGGFACDILIDNGQPDLTQGGVASENSQARPATWAADDFVTPPCNDLYIITVIEACVATNCGCGEFELAIFENRKIELLDEYDSPLSPPQFINCPALEPFWTTTKQPKVIPLGQSLTVNDENPDTLGGSALTVPAYALQYDFLPSISDLLTLIGLLDRGRGEFDAMIPQLPIPILHSGEHYWISVAGRGTDSATDRSYFCMGTDCRKPNCVKFETAKQLRAPFDQWDSVLTDSLDPCGLAFTICGQPLDLDIFDIPLPFPASGDVNNDGKVDSVDMFEVLDRVTRPTR